MPHFYLQIQIHWSQCIWQRTAALTPTGKRSAQLAQSQHTQTTKGTKNMSGFRKSHLAKNIWHTVENFMAIMIDSKPLTRKKLSANSADRRTVLQIQPKYEEACFPKLLNKCNLKHFICSTGICSNSKSSVCSPLFYYLLIKSYSRDL